VVSFSRTFWASLDFGGIGVRQRFDKERLNGIPKADRVFDFVDSV
jgi:hypothetical protein